MSVSADCARCTDLQSAESLLEIGDDKPVFT